MKTLFKSKAVSDFPDATQTDKLAVRTSTSTTLRRREPTNYQTASKNVNMVWDYSQQQKVWPDGRPNSLIEATQTTHTNQNYRTMNKSGKPYALGVMVGGAPDDRGTPFEKALPAKMIKG
jgi:hypothetical protein